MTLKTVDQDFASVGYDSFYSTEYNDEDSMESDAPSAQITSSSEYSGERELPTIDEDTAVFVKPPSLKKVTPDDLDDFEKVAEERFIIYIANEKDKVSFTDFITLNI